MSTEAENKSDAQDISMSDAASSSVNAAQSLPDNRFDLEVRSYQPTLSSIYILLCINILSPPQSALKPAI